MNRPNFSKKLVIFQITSSNIFSVGGPPLWIYCNVQHIPWTVMVPTYLQCFNLRAKFRLTFRNLILKSVVYSVYGNFIIYSEIKNCTASTYVYLGTTLEKKIRQNTGKLFKLFYFVMYNGGKEELVLFKLREWQKYFYDKYRLTKYFGNSFGVSMVIL